MNRITIIGNLTRDPETRTTATGKTVCQFTVAVNRRNKKDVDFFRCYAWEQLGDICSKYLYKGGKAAVVGSVSLSTYQSQDGQTRSSMDINASEVEFLSAKQGTQTDEQTGMQVVTEEGLPF